MEDSSTTASRNMDFSMSVSSRYQGLIDIPVGTQIIDAMVSFFNYLDNYAPRMPFLYNFVSVVRMLQLIGGAFMAANNDIYDPNTITYKAMSILTVTFHLVPVQYRLGKEYVILDVVSLILLIFGVYLLVTAWMYKTTSKVPKVSTNVLAIYIAVGPFILIPISVQYFGQIISSLIVGRTKDMISIISSIIGILIVIPYLWVMVKAYLITLTFRPCSFMSIEASPQWKFFFTTLIVTFVSSLTTYFTKWPSLAMICISAAGYVYCGTTCFNGGNFVLELHQVMVLGGSILGFILCLMNLYPLLSLKRWNEIFFVIFISVAVVCFLLTQVYVRLRYKRDLVILDKFEESQDITLFGSKGKFRRVVGTGYTFCHPACINFSVFKAAIVEWPESIDLWAEYAKFVAIYPELTPTLIYIGQSINGLNLKDSISTIIMSNIGYIMNTRETKITPALTSKISKLNKVFNKAKNRIRNIWDLILQGSVAEINHAIKSANEAVEHAEVEVSQLKSLYPNNRFVARQYAKFQGDINANAVEYKIWMENVRVLQAGKQVCPDIVHGLGVFVFQSLPESVEGSDGKSMMSINEMESVEELNDEQQAEEDANIEVLATLTRQIEKQRIPAIKCMYMSTCLGWFFTVFVPILALIIYYTTFREDLNAPLVFMYGISYMRNLLNMLAAFTAKFLFEELPNPKNPSEKVTDVIHLQEGFPLTGFGDDVRSREILKYLAAQVSSTSSMMSSLRSYKFGNALLEKARDMVFGSSIVFNFYTNRSMEYPMNSSVAQIAAMIATHIGSLITDDDITYDDARGSDYLTATNNNDDATEQMSSALLQCLEYILKTDENQKTWIISIMVCIPVAIIITWIITFNLQYKKLKSNKTEIMNVIVTLPKTVISTVSASFNHLKKNSASTTETNQGDEANLEDMSRQEQNIIKVFSQITDGSSSTTSESWNLLFFVGIVILGCVGSCVILFCYFEASKTLVYSSQHIDNMFGCSGYLYSVFSHLFKVSLQEYDEAFHDTTVDLANEIVMMKMSIPKFIDYFHKLRLGGTGKNQLPFTGMTNALKKASEIITCPDKFEPPTTIPESAHCFTAAVQLYLTSGYLLKYLAFISMENVSERTYPIPNDPDFEQIWQIGPIELYEAFFYRIGKTLTDEIMSGINKYGKAIKGVGITCIIVSMILMFMALALIHKEDILLTFTMRLLLFCPPRVVLSNSRIMDLIAGDYDNKDADQSAKHLAYSNEVVNKLNDSIIVIQDDETNKIINVNAAFEETFNIKSENLVGKSANEFFTNERFQGKIEAATKAITNLQFEKDGNTIFIEFTPVVVNTTKIISGRDKTQNILHEQLIEEERKKSDTMLASILPASLVPRVQAGEKNISFSVQSVTVLFFDVVEFTPWCGSHDAQYVMRMLNIVFKEMDAITNAHKTMTKIKCIGDCYMAAGGIFDEVNQPQIHAREVVDFGCLAIKKLLEIDEKENENLRIRVGINTGGPIVAGVIGTEKPTFEILGPAINIAHEMEHHGVPMKVHISRPVYEFIYGGQFSIKERGEIEVKGGKMFTYLVEP